jgi:non-heme chloroperoxidase
MSYITVGEENTSSIDLYYEDLGEGSPVVLIHGWPLSGASWEKQVTALLADGHRVITYDRRGFGRSSHPSTGYDYDTFATDLHEVLTALDLEEVALVGFSMGSGEVTRYLAKFGARRITRAVLIGTLGPYLLQARDNPAGVPSSVFEGLRAELARDRPTAVLDFLHEFYNYDVLGGKLVSERVVQENWTVGMSASAIALFQSVYSWCEDFREDLARNDVPTLILHGDADRILPPAATSRRQALLLPNSRFVELRGAPHGLLWTHAEQINAELVSFLREG